MITWDDVKELKVGDTIFEERKVGRKVVFIPFRVRFKDDSGLAIENQLQSMVLPRKVFPINHFYTEG